jgi:hypothetical protein
VRDLEAQQVESGPLVPAPFNPFDAAHVALYPAGVPFQVESGGDGVDVLAEAASQSAQRLQAGDPGLLQPSREVMSSAFGLDTS